MYESAAWFLKMFFVRVYLVLTLVSGSVFNTISQETAIDTLLFDLSLEKLMEVKVFLGSNIEDFDISQAPASVGEANFRVNNNHSLITSLRFSHIDIHNDNRLSPRIAYTGKKGEFNWKLFYTRAFRTPVPGTNPEIPTGGWFRHYHNRDI